MVQSTWFEHQTNIRGIVQIQSSVVDSGRTFVWLHVDFVRCLRDNKNRSIDKIHTLMN